MCCGCCSWSVRRSMATMGDLLSLFGVGSVEELASWPPDMFAFTSTVLERSDAHRRVVWPHSGTTWPPNGVGPEDWESSIRRVGVSWREAVEEGGACPTELATRANVLTMGLNRTLDQIDAEDRWEDLCAILLLHAWADEACVGVGLRTRAGAASSRFLLEAVELLADNKPLNKRGTTGVKVLPKVRTPQSGITIRSLSHHLSAYWGPVDVRWQDLVAGAPTGAIMNLLILPWPGDVNATDFQEVPSKAHRLDNLPKQMGFFQYQPILTPADWIARLLEARKAIQSAKKLAGQVDAIVIPESALDDSQAEAIRAMAKEENVRLLLCGIRESKPAELARNYISVCPTGAPKEHRFIQDKHHRWCLDGSQVQNYHLASVLDPNKCWWEAIELPRRSIGFLVAREWMVICPLICEDLARTEPVAEAVRAIGPTLVIALLFDGPQLSGRWPAHYATVLADDPGSSVLTVSCSGMVKRSRPPGKEKSNIVALWRDCVNGTREIPLDSDAVGVVLSVADTKRAEWTADGRSDQGLSTVAVLSSITQITKT